ncbi:MAG: CPBP family intramembrane metalloprotease [Frankiaceae bacterium]|nr:CPBP family intramembrane metalloprotease [Frankiaceae bacterium]
MFRVAGSAAAFLIIAWYLLRRAARKDRVEYEQFKKMTSASQRLAVYRKWLINGVAIIGGLGCATYIASTAFPGSALAAARPWGPIAWLHDALHGGLGIGLAIGAAAGALATLLPLRGRKGADAPVIGDIEALIPRTPAEVRYGLGLALSAGVFEEFLFRLGLPEMLFGAVKDLPAPYAAAISFAAPAALFALMHMYQGWAGMLGAGILGIMLSLVYLISGWILLAMLIHALIDVRSLVLAPLILRPWAGPRAAAAPEATLADPAGGA